MDQRGTASASPKNASPGSGEVLRPAWFSRVRSVLGKAIFSSRCAFFRGGPYAVALIRLSVFTCYFPFSYSPSAPFTLSSTPFDCVTSCVLIFTLPDRRLPPRRECKSEKEREIEREIALSLSRARARAHASEPVVALVRLLPAIGELEHRNRVNFLTISARDTASPANARQLERRIAKPSPSLGRFGH